MMDYLIGYFLVAFGMLAGLVASSRFQYDRVIIVILTAITWPLEILHVFHMSVKEALKANRSRKS